MNPKEAAITQRLRKWHPRHCASRRPTAVMPDGYPCNCGHEDAAAEIEALTVALRDVVVEAAEGSPLNLFDAITRAKDVLSGRGGA